MADQHPPEPAGAALERIEAVGERLSAAFALFREEARNPETSPDRVAEITAFLERAEQMLAPPAGS